MQKIKFIILISLLFFISGCSINKTLSGPKESSSEKQSTLVGIIPLASLPPPHILHQGNVLLSVDEKGYIRLIQGVFDFDENRIINVNLDHINGDILIFWGNSTYGDYLAIGPGDNNKIAYVFTKKGDSNNHAIDFNNNDCFSDNLNYWSKGGSPIGPDDVFCVKTNQGHVAEFVVSDIVRIPGYDHLYSVEINYVVWN